LTARSDSRLGEQLLQACFNCALRKLQTISNLLIRQAFENKRKHPSLPFRETNSAALCAYPFGVFEYRCAVSSSQRWMMEQHRYSQELIVWASPAALLMLSAERNR
jgi:hypothetical protein